MFLKVTKFYQHLYGRGQVRAPHYTNISKILWINAATSSLLFNKSVSHQTTFLILTHSLQLCRWIFTNWSQPNIEENRGRVYWTLNPILSPSQGGSLFVFSIFLDDFSPRAHLFEGWLALNGGLNLTLVSFSCVQKHFLWQFSLLFLELPIINL